jgi:enamine deaminase RidA (YjgF/YER057c/UK114 family)
VTTPLTHPTPALVLVDGRNFMGDLEECFGRDLAHQVDVIAFAEAALDRAGLSGACVVKVHVGVGNPNRDGPDPDRSRFWQAQVSRLRRAGVTVSTAPVYSVPSGMCPRCGEQSFCPACRTALGRMTPREKGVDVRIAIDATVSMLRGEYSALVLLSQDADFKPVFTKLRLEFGVDAPCVCAFPTCDARRIGARHLHSGIDPGRRGDKPSHVNVPVDIDMYQSAAERRLEV